MAEDWAADVKKYAPTADDNVIAGIVRYCGIALTKRDSSLVAFSDSKETDRVRNNFLKKKLARTEADSVLDAAIAAVGETMKADRTKNRVTVYYLLADKFDSLGLFLKSSNAKAKAPVKATGAAVEKKPAAKAAPKTKAAAAPKVKASGAAGAAAGTAALGLATMGSGGKGKAKVDTSTSAPAPAAPAPAAPAAPAAAANDAGLGAKATAALGAAGAAVTGTAATLASNAASAADKAGDAIGDAAGAAADTAGKAGAAVGGAAGAAATGAAALAGKAGDAVGGAASSAAGAASSLVDGRDDEGSSSWLWWLLLGLLALFALWWFFLRGPANTDAPALPAATEAAGAATGAANDLATAPAEGTVTIPTGAGVTSELRDGKPVVKVYFDTGKTDVATAFTDAAGGLKAWLDGHPGSTLAVSGFADPTGNAVLNAKLSKQRAQAVQAALVGAGIPEASAALVKPDDSTDTTVDKAAARRVEVVVR